MKSKKHSLLLVFMFCAFSLFSCMEYLDKTEKADITSDDIFKEFNSFQGFVETMYAAIVFPYRSVATGVDPNFGDDVWSGTGTNVLIPDVTAFSENVYNGNWHNWPSYLYSKDEQANRVLHYSNVAQYYPQSVWGGWKAVRAANIALANIDKMQGTAEEMELLAGQAYFFRAYFHWEIMRAWGAIPYVDKLLTGEDLAIPVFDFHTTAGLVMDDLQKAAELLPVDWELTEVGSRFLGNNYGRLTKGMALAFQSEVMLWCGSPMINGTVNGNYSYNEEYCKRAAGYAWEVIQMADQGVYRLVPYDSISIVFYNAFAIEPGEKERIFSGFGRLNDRWNSATYMQFTIAGGGVRTGSPNAAYIERYYGMANGLPTNDPESGYDPSNPFAGREPRFYKDLRIDRDRIAQTLPLTDPRATAQLYMGGRDRNVQDSRTGYGYKKFMDPRANTLDGWVGNNYHFNVPRLRLAEIYLFYAEAVNEAYGPNESHPGASFTAVQAVNFVRNRAGVPDVHSKYTGNKEDFRERIRSERAVELSFEVKRFFDIRRWYIAHLDEHKTIYSLNFDKDWTYFNKEVVQKNIRELKHYWLPFPTDQVNIYPEWKQNPGW